MFAFNNASNIHNKVIRTYFGENVFFFKAFETLLIKGRGKCGVHVQGINLRLITAFSSELLFCPPFYKATLMSGLSIFGRVPKMF